MQNFEIRYTCQEIKNLKYCKVGLALGASLILLFWKFCDLKQNIAIIDLQTLKLFWWLNTFIAILLKPGIMYETNLYILDANSLLLSLKYIGQALKKWYIP